MDTITSDSGVKYNIVFEGESIEYCSGESKKIETYYLQKSSQSGEVKTSSVGEDRSDTDMVTEIICKHSWYQRGLGNSRFCAICGFQEESATCKSCLGKKKLSVYTNQVISPDFIGDKAYHTGEDDIKYVNCSRCKGSGFEPKVESEKQDFGKILLDFIELHKSISYQEAKQFLSSNGYL